MKNVYNTGERTKKQKNKAKNKNTLPLVKRAVG